MTQALLLSIVAATVVLPALAARSARPVRALGALLLAFLFVSAVYVAVVVIATPSVEVR